METWKEVVGYEGLYFVSDLGGVKNIKTGHTKIPTQAKSGHMKVLLWKNNKGRLFSVHRLVLFAFRGPPKKGEQGCHNNGDPAINNLYNLRWDTARNNQLDRIIHGTSNRGERCAAAKLSHEQAVAIRLDPRKQRIIAAEYGVQQNTISRIKSGARWRHLQDCP